MGLAAGSFLCGARLSGAAERSALAKRLEHDFKKPELLERALTHSSIASRARPANERLEFLGDRVLNLVIAEALLNRDETAAEGEIAPRLNALVRKETCAAVAEDIALGDALILGRAEARSGGRRKRALLGDAMEAVIAAVYQDAGFETAKALILRLWSAHLATAAALGRDPKTELQEYAQSRAWSLPNYKDLAREGPDHAPVFTVQVTLENGAQGLGTATSKRAAQQAAAQNVLTIIRENPDVR